MQAVRPSLSRQWAVPQKDKLAVHAVITNSTYNGLCYNVERVLEIMGDSVDRIHFDEAWYGYDRFNPLYEKRYGMLMIKGPGLDPLSSLPPRPISCSQPSPRHHSSMSVTAQALLLGAGIWLMVYPANNASNSITTKKLSFSKYFVYKLIQKINLY